MKYYLSPLLSLLTDKMNIKLKINELSQYGVNIKKGYITCDEFISCLKHLNYQSELDFLIPAINRDHTLTSIMKLKGIGNTTII